MKVTLSPLLVEMLREPKTRGQIRKVLERDRVQGWVRHRGKDYYLTDDPQRTPPAPPPGLPSSEPVSGPLYVPYTGPATDIPWEE
jgi:hypothetical protein